MPFHAVRRDPESFRRPDIVAERQFSPSTSSRGRETRAIYGATNSGVARRTHGDGIDSQ